MGETCDQFTHLWNETNVKHCQRNPPKNVLWSNSHLGDKVNNIWRNPPRSLFWSNSHLPNKTAGETNVKNCLREHSKEPFKRRKPFAAKEPKNKSHFAPRTLLWLKTPKLTLLKKMQEKGEELGDKFKELIGNLPQTFLAPQNGSARHHETCATLLEPELKNFNLGGPWWNLPRNLLAGQDGSRTIESPKAILPRNLCNGWTPRSYCCWGKTKLCFARTASCRNERSTQWQTTSTSLKTNMYKYKIIY